jgi:hypothetical protein
VTHRQFINDGFPSQTAAACRASKESRTFNIRTFNIRTFNIPRYAHLIMIVTIVVLIIIAVNCYHQMDHQLPTADDQIRSDLVDIAKRRPGATLTFPHSSY